MPFIGNQPAEKYSSFQKQDFTTSATTSYTLDHPVTNENEIALFINFVRQEPSTAYTASGTSLTLTSATSASDDMYCVFLGKAVQTVNPPNGSVGLSQLSATGTKDATTFLRGDNTFATAGGDNTPAFEAYLNANQSVSDNSITKITIDTEVVDTDNAYDNSTNYRFTPQTAGKYFVYGSVSIAQGDQKGQIYLRKNGSDYKSLSSVLPLDEFCPITFQAIVDMNGSSDYLELFARVNTSSTGQQINTGTKDTYFGAYKLIGV